MRRIRVAFVATFVLAGVAPASSSAEETAAGSIRRTVQPSTGARAGDQAGRSVDLSGDRLILGAPYADGGGADSGAAFVFSRTGENWVQQAKLVAPTREAGAWFGSSVAIQGDVAVVGEPYADSSGINAGRAHVFRYTEGAWSFSETLEPESLAAGDAFGSALAIDDGNLIVGAPGDDQLGTDAGAAYPFTDEGLGFTLAAKILYPGGAPGDRFGSAIAVDGPRALVGAPERDAGAADSGATFRFEYGTSWTYTAALTPTVVLPGSRFGSSVAISGDYAIVGRTAGSTEESAAFWYAPPGFTRVGSVRQGVPGTIDAGVAMDGENAAVILTDTNGENGEVRIFHREDDGLYHQNVFPVLPERFDGAMGTDIAVSGSTTAVGTPRLDIDSVADLGGALTYALDTDRDVVRDDVDNCLDVFNPIQQDRDTDGAGDACDPPAGPRPDVMVKKRLSSAPFVGENVYNTTAVYQTAHGSHRPGGRAEFRVKVENDGSAAGDFVFFHSHAPDGMNVRFKSGDNFTEFDDPLEFRLEPGASRTFGVVVVIERSVPVGREKTMRFTASADTRNDVAAISVSRRS